MAIGARMAYLLRREALYAEEFGRLAGPTAFDVDSAELCRYLAVADLQAKLGRRGEVARAIEDDLDSLDPALVPSDLADAEPSRGLP